MPSAMISPNRAAHAREMPPLAVDIAAATTAATSVALAAIWVPRRNVATSSAEESSTGPRGRLTAG